MGGKKAEEEEKPDQLKVETGAAAAGSGSH